MQKEVLKMATNNKKIKGNLSSEHSAVIEVTSRAISKNKLPLYVLAGGRCEMCNAYLMRHHLSHDIGNYAQVAHIVAFKEDASRGKDGDRPSDINNLNNLMLLCYPCHHLIDKVRPLDYPRKKLEGIKQKHEERIYRLTEIQESNKTTVVQLKALINGDAVDIPAANVYDAIYPRYAEDPKGYVIDLTNIENCDESFYQCARETIEKNIQRLYQSGMSAEKTRHISLFALAPIPLLIFLGNRLSNKIAVDAYQRHRDTEDWKWKTIGKPVEYTFKTIQTGIDLSKVALIISLSGSLNLSKLPKEIDEQFFVYEITLSNQIPTPTFLRLKDDLENFKATYQHSLRLIEASHPNLCAIHLFPAVPAPVAVHCGRELLPKIDPAFFVYDNDKKSGGFKLIFEVNNT
jgi:hypothetical protein